MRYFREIAFWKIALLNIVVGVLMSGPLLIGIVLCNGLFTPPTQNERIQGIFIFIGIILVLILSNFLLWRFGKRVENITSGKEKDKSNMIKLVFILILLCLTVGSFFFIPHLWITLNDWWF